MRVYLNTTKAVLAASITMLALTIVRVECPADTLEGGRILYVDNIIGSDNYDGLAKSVQGKSGPFLNITTAIKAAGAGDTVSINQTGKLYRQSADFYNHKGGTPEKPLVLEGNGATISGGEICSPEGWVPRDTKPINLEGDWKSYPGPVLQRSDLVSVIFLLVDNQMVLETLNFNVIKPGEICYMAGSKKLDYNLPAGKTMTDIRVEIGLADGTTQLLEPSRWQASGSRIKTVRRYTGIPVRPAWVKIDGVDTPLVEARDRLQPGEWCAAEKVMYFLPPRERKLTEMKIEAIVRGNAVQLSGNTANVVIKNVNACHIFNDGFNIHGAVKNARFFNCNAYQCGDEGFSAHDSTETWLDGAIYEQCDNGIANVNNSGFSITKNVIIRNSRAVGYLIQGSPQAKHEISDSIFIDNPNQVSLFNTQADNIMIVRSQLAGQTKSHALSADGKSSVKQLTVAGNNSLLRVNGGSEVILANILVGPGQGPIHIRDDDPAARLKISTMTAAPGLKIEWGSKYPWKTMPIGEWLTGDSKESFKESAEIAPLLVGLSDNPAKIEAAQLKAFDRGCSVELLKRYMAYMKGLQQ